MRSILPILVLVACQPDPLIPELEARPDAVNFGPAEVGQDGPHERVRFVNVGETTVRVDRWSLSGEGAARLRLDGPDLPVDVPPEGRVELILRLDDLQGLEEESAEIAVEFRGYSGVGEAGSLAVPVSVVVPGRCDADEDGFHAERCGGDDCDDADAEINPGALEICNDLDDDCDGEIDPVGTEGSGVFYADTDGDGFGDLLTEIFRCEAAPGEVADGSDCDDTRFRVNPGEPERCNELDDDCDGAIDEEAFNAFTHYADVDGDRFGAAESAVTSCDLPGGRALVDGDCDDANAEVRPGRAETCNGVDDDCDGEIDEAAVDSANWFPDADGDGAGGVTGRVRACVAPSGFLATATDCDDADPAVFPGGTEVCNGKDDDCDGLLDEDGEGDRATWYRDADGDSHGDPRAAQAACGTPAGYVQSPTDCDDLDAQAFPEAPERCNGKDDDCDGVVDDGAICEEICGNGDDDDADGAADCDDPDCATDPTCAPAEEICFNNLDDDANGLIDCDDPACASQLGCALVEVCGNGQDDDGDGAIDCEDSECAGRPECDVDPTDEICTDNADNDGDGAIDCDDSDCFADPACFGPPPEEVCSGGVDEDQDGLVDCADPDCVSADTCFAEPGLWVLGGEAKIGSFGTSRALSCTVPVTGTVFERIDSEAHNELVASNIRGLAVYVTADGRTERCGWTLAEDLGYTDFLQAKDFFDVNPLTASVLMTQHSGFAAEPGCPVTEADLPAELLVQSQGGLGTISPGPGFHELSLFQPQIGWYMGASAFEGVDEVEQGVENVEIGPIVIPCASTARRFDGTWVIGSITPSTEPWPWAPSTPTP